MDENRASGMKDRLRAYVIISQVFFVPLSLSQEGFLIAGKLRRAS